VLFVAAAIAVRRALELWVGTLPYYITLFPTITLIALLTGLRPSLFAVVVASVTAPYFVLPPEHAFLPLALTDAVGLALFLGTCVFIAVVCELYRRSTRLAVEQAQELALQNEQARARDLFALAIKQANLELAQAREAADSANVAKSQFLANMSHELRTPLTAILGFTDIMAGEDCTPEEQREYLEVVQQSSRSLLQLIDDILDLSKIEAGKAVVELVDCPPLRVLEEVIALMRGRASDKHLTLDVRYRYPLPQIIRSDPKRLRQILVNLLSNAIKFTQRGGVQVDVSFDAGSMLRFAVSDTGIGIAPDRVADLFQPFRQADSSIGRRFGGTGLGLAISMRWAEMLGGGITVESVPGQGSTFTLSIDAGSLADRALIREPPPPAQHPTDGRCRLAALRARVLLIEDRLDNQRVTRAMLCKAGLEVDVAEDGQEGYWKALGSTTNGSPYHVILMDIQMPGLDGIQTTRKLRQDGWKGPIIALTAQAMAGDREKCLQAGCDDYLPKPIDREALLRMVAHHLTT
jgi:two-component system CheB/CheR fusion protein